MLRYPGGKLTAIEEDEMLGELNQPLRKVAKTGFAGLQTCSFLSRWLLEFLL